MLIQVLIIQFITFVGLIFVLRLLFHRHLNTAVIRLKKLHEENLVREEELKNELEKARQEKEQELTQAREEAGLIIKEAKERSERVNSEVSALAKEEANKIVERAKADAQKFENELAANYQEKAVELSVAILKCTFSQQGKEALQQQMINELIEEIEKLAQDRFTVKTKQAKVVSALTLTAEQKDKLSRILAAKVGEGKMDIEEIVDTQIIAGLIIHVGALTIDGSLKNKLLKVIPYLKAQD